MELIDKKWLRKNVGLILQEPFLYAKTIKENIGIAAITNHNKFDFNEYKALAKKARKQEIYVLPGVELSVNDGCTILS